MAAKKIIVFTTPTCSWCNRVKSYLSSNKISFREVDISKNESAAKDVVRITGQNGVPVILIDNKPIVGFDKAKLERFLEIKSANGAA